MPKKLFTDDTDVKKFWAYIMSRPQINLDAIDQASQKNLHRRLERLVKAQEQIASEKLTQPGRLKRLVTRQGLPAAVDRLNRAQAYLLQGGHAAPDVDIFKPLPEIRRHIEEGQYDYALQCLQINAAQLRSRHAEAGQALGIRNDAVDSQLEKMTRDIGRYAEAGLRPYHFSFLGKDENADIRQLFEMVHKEGCTAMSFEDLRSETESGYRLHFALTPLATRRLRRLIAQYPPSAQDEERYAAMAFLLSQEGRPVVLSAAAHDERDRQRAAEGRQREAQKEAIARVLSGDSEITGGIMTVLDRYYKARQQVESGPEGLAAGNAAQPEIEARQALTGLFADAVHRLGDDINRARRSSYDQQR